MTTKPLSAIGARHAVIEECIRAIMYAPWRERDAHYYDAGKLAMETLQTLPSHVGTINRGDQADPATGGSSPGDPRPQSSIADIDKRLEEKLAYLVERTNPRLLVGVLKGELLCAWHDVHRLHREKMDALYGPDGKPRSAIAPSQQDAAFVRVILDTLRNNPYPTLGGTATWQSVEVWAEDFLRRAERTGSAK